MYRFLFFTAPLLFLLTHQPAHAQKVLQIEKRNSPKTTKLFIGDAFSYRLYGTERFRTAYIEDLLVEEKLIATVDRYIPMDSIAALRYDQSFGKIARVSLYTFGAAWSGLALVGTATDKNPDTSYRWSDAIVTGTSGVLGWLSGKLFSGRKLKMGKKRRLRMLNLSPVGKPNKE